VFPALKRIEGIKRFCLAVANTYAAQSNTGILKQNIPEKGKYLDSS